LDWLNHMSLNTDLCDDSKKFNKKVAGHKRLQRYRVRT
jgi:hypothetical protein